MVICIIMTFDRWYLDPAGKVSARSQESSNSPSIVLSWHCEAAMKAIQLAIQQSNTEYRLLLLLNIFSWNCWQVRIVSLSVFPLERFQFHLPHRPKSFVNTWVRQQGGLLEIAQTMTKSRLACLFFPASHPPFIIKGMNTISDCIIKIQWPVRAGSKIKLSCCFPLTRLQFSNPFNPDFLTYCNL